MKKTGEPRLGMLRALLKIGVRRIPYNSINSLPPPLVDESSLSLLEEFSIIQEIIENSWVGEV